MRKFKVGDRVKLIKWTGMSTLEEVIQQMGTDTGKIQNINNYITVKFNTTLLPVHKDELELLPDIFELWE